MESIIFIGSRETGFFAEEVAKKHKYHYRQIEAPGNIKAVTNEILMLSHKEKVICLIYDVDAFINDAADIAKEIAQTAKAVNAKAIAYMPSFMPESVMTQALLAVGIKRYILSGSAASLKEQLVKNLSQYYDVNGRDEVEAAEEKRAEAEAKIENFRTIGVAGTQSRIGTTTQALQIIKYLQAKGYTACYIEMNRTRYFDLSSQSGAAREASFVEKCRGWSQSESGMVTAENIDMYIGYENLNLAKQRGYDYYVFDYGSILERDFDRTAFVKDDVRITVAGGGITEFDYLQQFLKVPLFADCSLIISFVGETKEKVMKLISQFQLPGQGENGRLYLFAEQIEDPFGVPDLALYEKLVPVELSEAMKETQKQEVKEKKGLFRRKGRGKK